jgi:hypothetical protein
MPHLRRNPEAPITVKTSPTRRYVTWRLPDRHFSKVHLTRDQELTICGRTLPRATGSPVPPIPASELCPECAASED